MTKLSVLLNRYDQSALTEKILGEGIDPFSYMTIDSDENGFLISPTPLFVEESGAISTEVQLDKNLLPLRSHCGCLEFYRKKECLHTTLLHALALKELDEERFKKEWDLYRYEKRTDRQRALILKMAEDLKNNPFYFNKIRLIPEITETEQSYSLSLHIGYDKEYVIKSIGEFMDRMEHGLFYAYGKKLAFVHSYEALDEESKELYSFLLNIASSDSLKSILIRRSQLLKILEIYHQSGLYYSNGTQTDYYSFKEMDSVRLKLDDRLLSIDMPKEMRKWICGVNFAYFFTEGSIYIYRFKKRNEAIVFSYLFKIKEEGLYLDNNIDEFMSVLLPFLQSEITIDDSFYQKYDLPLVTIDSYFVYQNAKILLNYVVHVEEKYQETPYVSYVMEGYFQTIESYGFAKEKEDTYILSSLEMQYAFLTSDLSSVKRFGTVYFDESVKKITLKKNNRIGISASYQVGLLDFRFDLGTLSIEEAKRMLAAYRNKKKFVRLKKNVILKIDAKEAKKIDRFLEDYNIALNDWNLSVEKPFYYLAKSVFEDEIVYDERSLKMLGQLRQYQTNSYPIEEPFLSVLRPYQKEAFQWLMTLSTLGFGGILADDMGLGKTLEILSFIHQDTIPKPTIIVCPMSLIYNWENECKKWNVNLPVVLILGNASEREEKIASIDYESKSIYITSYDSLRRDIDFYHGMFRFVIADEAQYIKNQHAMKSEAVKKLRSQIHFALTGTPIENGLADLWSIFDFIMPGYLGEYHHFKSRYESLILQKDEETLRILKKRVQPFILRGRKEDVLSDLPPKTEEVYYCKMDEEQQTIYQAYASRLKDSLKSGGQDILALITRLRQICITPELIYDKKFSSAKLSLALELTQRALRANHRLLIFSQFATVFPILGAHLQENGIHYQILDGTTPAQRRMELVDDFNRNPAIQVFMISLKAGGTGLNLTGADMVIHLDPWWNISAEKQASDRAHRFGQTKHVHILKLVCKDTIEEKVLKLQQAKQDLADNVIKQKESFKISKQELLALLEGGNEIGENR